MIRKEKIKKFFQQKTFIVTVLIVILTLLTLLIFQEKSVKDLRQDFIKEKIAALQAKANGDLNSYEKHEKKAQEIQAKIAKKKQEIAEELTKLFSESELKSVIERKHKELFAPAPQSGGEK